MTGDAQPHYIHGSSAEEQQRLSRLNDLLNQTCLDAIDLTGVTRILDVGSGLGQLTRAMANALDGPATVVGVERDERQLAAAIQLSKDAGQSDRVTFRLGDALALPLEAEEVASFDLAHARFVLEHVPQHAEMIQQMVQAVRPGGRVVVADDDHDTMRLWPEPAGFASLWRAYVESFSRAGNDPYIGRKLVTLLHDAGLQSIRSNQLFFGGCAGNDTFYAVVDNLLSAFVGAQEDLLTGGLIDENKFAHAIKNLRDWKTDPSAAVWFTVCWAEGTRVSAGEE